MIMTTIKDDEDIYDCYFRFSTFSFYLEYIVPQLQKSTKRSQSVINS